MYCDGEWATAGADGTDAIGNFHFVDGEWTAIEPDGRTSTTRHRCHDIDKLREEGAPEEVLENVIPCG